LPLLIFALKVWAGYYYRDHWEFELGFVTLPVILAVAGLFLFITFLIVLTSRQGKRAFPLALHTGLVILVLAGGRYTGANLGRWLWDQTILEPRREAILEFARHPEGSTDGSVTIAGYTFPRYESTPQGMMLYALLRGPFPDEGVFVPAREGYRGFSPPDEGEPRKASSVTPTSVRGLYWFETRD
jgi:hypothetical protein